MLEFGFLELMKIFCCIKITLISWQYFHWSPAVNWMYIFLYDYNSLNFIRQQRYVIPKCLIVEYKYYPLDQTRKMKIFAIMIWKKINTFVISMVMREQLYRWQWIQVYWVVHKYLSSYYDCLIFWSSKNLYIAGWFC